MRRFTFRIALLAATAGSLALASCESTESTNVKKRPPLPGEEVNELNWNRPTGPNDIVTPMGLPMSR